MRYFYCLVGVPQIICFLLFKNKIVEIKEDLIKYSGGGNLKRFISQLPKKEYRNVFYYRLPFTLRHLLNITLPRVNTCSLQVAEIGGGMKIHHGYSSIVCAEKVGRNFQFYQNVTVGWGKNGKPTIGDNVSIYTGAVVAGQINIGNNVRIAANSVVRQDIPNNSLVYGNPCVIRTIE